MRIHNKPKHLKRHSPMVRLGLGALALICLVGVGAGLWWCMDNLSTKEVFSRISGFLDGSAHAQTQPVGMGAAARTVTEIPAATGVGSATSKDTMVLAKVISGEARGETYVGQVAVGAVIINRTKNPNFPNSVYGVVFEPGAFDAVKDGQYYQEPSASALKAAKDAIGGWDPSNGAIYYWNPVTATSSWIWSRPIIARIGNHVFAK